MRLFIAIDIPDSQKEIISNFRKTNEKCFSGGSFVGKEKYHVTLAFLGDFDMSKIIRAMETTKFSSFSVRFDKIGNFSTNRGYIYWIGGDTVKDLKALHSSLLLNLETEGVCFSNQKFKMHITLARNVCNNIDFKEKAPVFDIKVSEITLYDSTKNNDGAYEYCPIFIKKALDA